MSCETTGYESCGASQHRAEHRQSTSLSHDQSEHVAPVGAKSDAESYADSNYSGGNDIARFHQTLCVLAALLLSEGAAANQILGICLNVETQFRHPSGSPSENAPEWPAPRIEGDSRESYFLGCGT
jgi:hypothetical protein